MKRKLNYKIIFIVLLLLILGFIAVLYYFNDDKIHTLEEYNSERQLIGSTEYIIRKGDTILEGKFLRFNDNGIKISEGRFIDNEPNGLCFYYYDNGDLKSVHYRKNSKITLESTFYNPDGLLEKYALYDNFGKEAFIISFDEKGVRKYDGYSQLEIYQYRYTHKEQYNIKEEQHLKVGDTLKYSYIIANIPNAKRSHIIQNLSIDNSKVKRTLKKVLPAQIDVREVLIKKGQNTIRSIVKYEFDDKVTPTIVDTLSFNVEVN